MGNDAGFLKAENHENGTEQWRRMHRPSRVFMVLQTPLTLSKQPDRVTHLHLLDLADAEKRRWISALAGSSVIRSSPCRSKPASPRVCRPADVLGGNLQTHCLPSSTWRRRPALVLLFFTVVKHYISQEKAKKKPQTGFFKLPIDPRFRKQLWIQGRPLSFPLGISAGVQLY